MNRQRKGKGKPTADIGANNHGRVDKGSITYIIHPEQDEVEKSKSGNSELQSPPQPPNSKTPPPKHTNWGPTMDLKLLNLTTIRRRVTVDEEKVIANELNTTYGAVHNRIQGLRNKQKAVNEMLGMPWKPEEAKLFKNASPGQAKRGRKPGYKARKNDDDDEYEDEEGEEDE